MDAMVNDEPCAAVSSALWKQRHVWQGRYKSFMVQEDSHLLMVLRYIEGNPVRAKMVDSAKEWRWSSHNEVIGVNKRGLVEKAPIELPKRVD